VLHVSRHNRQCSKVKGTRDERDTSLDDAIIFYCIYSSLINALSCSYQVRCPFELGIPEPTQRALMKRGNRGRGPWHNILDFFGLD
jgi:hypothetical protein